MSNTSPFAPQSESAEQETPRETLEESKHQGGGVPEDGGPALLTSSGILLGSGGAMLGAAWVQECLQLLLATLGSVQLIVGALLLLLFSKKRVVLFSRHQPTPVPEDQGEG